MVTKMSLALSLMMLVGIGGAPRPRVGRNSEEIERSLEEFLELYYAEYLGESDEEKEPATTRRSLDIYEQMMGDQPVDGEGGQGNISEYVRTMKNRSKDTWIQILKNNILAQIGRGNNTSSKTEGLPNMPVNISQIIPNILNGSNLMSDDQITEKIRSFYPSCEIPTNTDQEIWKDDDVMNLYFNFDYPTDGKTTNIATATLRLYRLPQNGTKFSNKKADCDLETNEEEKLLRVSIYWYTRSLKKSKRAKRRLSDSKVVPEGSRWVELSIRPAARAWSRGRNLGLAVLVEDQEGNALRADHYFKGASCMVGQSTPKPIPTIVSDAARQSNELDRIHRLLGGGAAAAGADSQGLLPTVDVCTLHHPENYTGAAGAAAALRVNACNLRRAHEARMRQAERERAERLATLRDLVLPSTRHIRHQRQHLADRMRGAGGGAEVDFEPIRAEVRDRQVVLTNEELQMLPDVR